MRSDSGAETLLEVSIVMQGRFGEAGGRELDLFVHKTGIEIIPVDNEQVTLARRAGQQFGKGRHAAGLNYGDCFSYAASKATGEQLLFKGDDFARTDVVAAMRVGSIA